MTLTIGLTTRILRKLGIEMLIERFCRVLSDGIARSCCQSVLGRSTIGGLRTISQESLFSYLKKSLFLFLTVLGSLLVTKLLLMKSLTSLLVTKSLLIKPLLAFLWQLFVL